MNDQIFVAWERLLVLLNKPPSAANNRNLKQSSVNFTAVMKVSLFFLRLPLEGLSLCTHLAKKLKRQREYILANRKTTLEERMRRRAGLYKEGDLVPEKKVTELSPDQYRSLLRMLVGLDIFSVRKRLLALLEQKAPLAELDTVFREFFVAYELLELSIRMKDWNYVQRYSKGFDKA